MKNKYIILLLGALALLIAGMPISHAHEPAQEKDPVNLTPDAQTQLIYNKIHKASGLEFKRPLYVQVDPDYNAWASLFSVTITTGGLNLIGQYPDLYKHQVAYIFGHELGHVLHKHLMSSASPLFNNKISRNNERQADWEGIRIMVDAGFDCHKAVKFEYIFAREYSGFQGPDGTHPDSLERAKSIEHYCNVYTTTGVMPAIIGVEK